jgi:very-long-chain (3R)-3-hydroxyacyl-CoA dehydratase
MRTHKEERLRCVCRYAFAQAGHCPYFFTWIRYTAFILVYPAGLISELVCMWNVIPLVEKSRRLSVDMPNAANIVFDYSWFLRILLVAQPLFWWPIYSSLWVQRRKKLASKPKVV